MNKGRIRGAYDKSAAKYDANSSLQMELAEKIAGFVGSEFKDVLDIGCGTGHLCGRLNGARAVGCDLSFGMLAQARKKKGSHLFLLQADAEKLPFKGGSFDLVVSNAAYQWAGDLTAVFREVKRALRGGGHHYFTIFNNNTLWQLQESADGFGIPSASFVDKKRLEESLQEAGFKIMDTELVTRTKYYKALPELLTRLKQVSATAATGGLVWRGVLKKTEERYRDKFGTAEGIPATYEAFLVRAKKG